MNGEKPYLSQTMVRKLVREAKEQITENKAEIASRRKQSKALSFLPLSGQNNNLSAVNQSGEEEGGLVQ